MTITQAAKALHADLTCLTTPNWLHGVCVSDDKTLITVHVIRKGYLGMATYIGRHRIQYVECNGLRSPCMYGVGKGNIPA